MPPAERITSAMYALTSSGTLRDRGAAIAEALRLACAMLDAEAAALTTIEGRAAVRHVLQRGRPATAGPAPRASLGLVRSAFAEGAPLAVSDPGADARFAPGDAPPGLAVHNAVVAPVRVRQQDAAALACYNLPRERVREAVTARELALLAGCIGLVLENVRLSHTLKHVAVTDELTQVYNYRFLRTALRREMKRATRSRQPFVLLMVDVDHLKDYNDRFGHLAGSRLLRDLARVLARRVRGMDLVAKYGGDEFTVILPETKRAGGLAVAERIRASVESYSFARCKPGEMTVSIGLSIFPDDGISPANLIAAADAALFAAKQRGRNRTVEATGLILPGLQCA
jgi:diguanylate cyclase (GGDEF)-like protein